MRDTLGMDKSHIRYHFAFTENDAPQEITFDVDLDRESTRSLPIVKSWTALSQNQCSNCPLPASDDTCCPPAVDCAAIVERFAHTLSIESVRVEVEMTERTVCKNTDMQTALGSLLGLVMASSGCPMLSQFKGMARFHLPFATPQETLFRTVGAFLMKQYFAAKKGQDADLELGRLQRFYEGIQEVNQAFVQRVRLAAARDANLNALVILFSTSALVGFSLEQEIKELEPFFG
ncbi:MAG: hypothetical protein GY822_28280 [Deltaproteobacteria bacterium]|nr:hypothetical protein [Deltaproteobacteria bacterium]